MRKDNSFSQRIINTPPSGIRKFFELTIGHDDIISLGVGEPDFATPWVCREEAFYHLEKGETSYTSNWGLIDLRKEIAQYMAKQGMKYDAANEILITIGGSEAVDLALRTVLNAGDEIIVCEPCYVSYQPLAELCGAHLVHLDTSADGFVPTAKAIEQKLTDKTKVIMLCSPSNPTGRVIGESELEKIAQIAKEHSIWVISDEIYCELLYDGKRHHSIGAVKGMKDWAIVINGFSKSFAMTGWRIGWMAAPSDLMAQAVKLHQYSSICAPIMSQYAAMEGLRHGMAEVERMRRSYERRRNLMVKGFADMGLPCIEPEGAFYVFPDIRGTALTSEEFARRLIEEKKVAVVPGGCFGKAGEGFVRCCYATDIDKIKTALSRMKDMVFALMNK